MTILILIPEVKETIHSFIYKVIVSSSLVGYPGGIQYLVIVTIITALEATILFKKILFIYFFRERRVEGGRGRNTM